MAQILVLGTPRRLGLGRTLLWRGFSIQADVTKRGGPARATQVGLVKFIGPPRAIERSFPSTVRGAWGGTAVWSRVGPKRYIIAPWSSYVST